MIIMCAISEYAEYGYACFSGSWQVGETKISAGGVSYACVNPTRYSPHASLARFRTRPTRSSPKLTPATRTQDSGSTVSPGSSTRREYFSANTGSLRHLSMGQTRATQRRGFSSRVPSVETSPHMNELKGKQRNSQESLIHFHRANLHTAFPFGKPQALTQP